MAWHGGGWDRLERSAQRITKVNRSDIETHLATRDARQVQQIVDKLLRCDGIPESEHIRRPKEGWHTKGKGGQRASHATLVSLSAR